MTSNTSGERLVNGATARDLSLLHSLTRKLRHKLVTCGSSGMYGMGLCYLGAKTREDGWRMARRKGSVFYGKAGLVTWWSHWVKDVMREESERQTGYWFPLTKEGYQERLRLVDIALRRIETAMITGEVIE